MLHGPYKFSRFLEQFFFLSLVYYTQPPSGTIRLTLDMFLLCVCEQLCPWQDCADVQAHLSLRWLHVRLMNWLVSLTAQCKA